MKNKTPLHEAIREARQKRGLSQADLGELIGGVTRSAVSQWESGKTIPATEKLFQIAEVLKIPASNLIPNSTNSGTMSHTQNISDSTRPSINGDISRGVRGEITDTEDDEGGVEPAGIPVPSPWSWTKDLKVMGGAECGEGDGWFQIAGDPVDIIGRPPVLTGIKKAFAVFAVGDSMAPLYQDGDPIYIHPGRRLAVGKDVLVQIQDDDGEVIKATVKRLVKQTPTKLIVEQFNPPRIIEYDINTVKSALRVLSLKELMGL